MQRLSNYFDGIAWKYLSAVDAEPDSSNQHEFGGLKKAGFAQYLGEPLNQKIRYAADFVFLNEEELDSLSATGTLTWYDCRLDQSHRSAELRLYYSGNAVSEQMQATDFCVLAKRKDGSVLVVVCRQGSTQENQLRWLFGLPDVGETFSSRAAASVPERSEMPAQWIMEALGIATAPEVKWETYLDQMLKKFDGQFPVTRDFSEFARSCTGIDWRDAGADTTLITWLETEESLFRVFERHLVELWLNDGFEDVDDFISKSLSVQNRRKARAGYSLENHLEHLFLEMNLSFSRGAESENRSKPDFLFPSVKNYHDPNFPASNLRMLGAKSTCKDRWRQVLTEAERIERKHLITLEPAITERQTKQMQSANLQLVVPLSIQETFSQSQQAWLLSLDDFITEVRAI